MEVSATQSPTLTTASVPNALTNKLEAQPVIELSRETTFEPAPKAEFEDRGATLSVQA